MAGWFRKGADKVLKGEIDWVNDPIYAWLVGYYDTPDYATHEFIGTIPTNTMWRVNGGKVALQGKAVVNGAIDANDLLFPSVANPGMPIVGIVIFKQVGTGTLTELNTSPVLMFLDGKYPVIVAEQAGVGSTTIKVDRLAGSLNSGTVLDFGGGVTATLSASATAGARSVSVNALTSQVAVNSMALPRVANSGFPFTANGADFPYIFDDGPNRIFRI